MEMRWYRFVGDHTAYRVEGEQGREGWVDAYCGITDRGVRINLDQAYMESVGGPDGYGAEVLFEPTAITP